jgi:hypothetical protein
MLRDESMSEEGSEMSENEELLKIAGEDGLDLPSEDDMMSDEEDLGSEGDEEYYAELGI